MCEPVTAAIVVGSLAVASAGASVAGQIQSAKAQQALIERQDALAADEIKDQATADINERSRAARRERARIRVAAGEAGLNLQSGSIEALLMDSLFQQSFDNTGTVKNAENAQRARHLRTESLLANQASRPTILAAGLQVATSGLEGASQGYRLGLGIQEARKGNAE